MQILDLTLTTLEENLALDEALLIEAEDQGTLARGEVLRFWEWPRWAVVLGAGGEIEKDVNREACQADGIPILRRSSGGGTVLLGPGCLLFSLILSQERTAELTQVNRSYQWILMRIARALRSLGAIEHEGICDLTWSGRKVSGNAQQRKQRYILHHGTLLYDFDLKKLNEYLKEPERQPEYRRQRDHLEFVANLPATGVELKSLLLQEWPTTPYLETLPLPRVSALLEDKYLRADWVFRR